MAIKGKAVGNPIVRDRLHLTAMSFGQKPQSGSLKTMDITCKLYGLDGEEKVFDNREIHLSIKDFNALMVEMLQADGVEDIPQAVSDARLAANSMSIADCFAAFEAGIGLVMKHYGKFDFTGTE